jgi:glucosamine kinase
LPTRPALLTAPRFLVGIDGGGSGTRARLADAQGRVLGSGRAGPSALGQGVAQAWRHIGQALDAAFAAAGQVRPPNHEVAFGLGLAGIERPTRRDEFAAANPDFAHCAVFSDAQTTLRGAFGGGPGVVIAAGTGSIGLAQQRDGSQRRVGGWGFPAGDEGSGAWLGLRAMQVAQGALDGRAPAGPLARAVWRVAGADADTLLQWCEGAGQHAYAQLAPAVFDAAHDGDPAAAALLDAAAAELARHIDALSTNPSADQDLPIVLAGSIGQRLQDRLAPALRARCVAPLGDSADGALALLRDALRESTQ